MTPSSGARVPSSSIAVAGGGGFFLGFGRGGPEEDEGLGIVMSSLRPVESKLHLLQPLQVSMAEEGKTMDRLKVS